jgi:hypothetical protein
MYAYFIVKRIPNWVVSAAKHAVSCRCTYAWLQAQIDKSLRSLCCAGLLSHRYFVRVLMAKRMTSRRLQLQQQAGSQARA